MWINYGNMNESCHWTAWLRRYRYQSILSFNYKAKTSWSSEVFCKLYLHQKRFQFTEIQYEILLIASNAFKTELHSVCLSLTFPVMSFLNIFRKYFFLSVKQSVSFQFTSESVRSLLLLEITACIRILQNYGTWKIFPKLNCCTVVWNASNSRELRAQLKELFSLDVLDKSTCLSETIFSAQLTWRPIQWLFDWVCLWKRNNIF